MYNNYFDLLKLHHPTIQAFLYQNDVEQGEINLGFLEGVLLEGTGDNIMDLQSGSNGFRLFASLDDINNLKMRTEELGGYFFKIDNVKYQIENAKKTIAINSRTIKFNLFKNAD